MRVYQLIFTAVNFSLSDPMLGFENKPGYRVYSCTQGLSKEEIDEVLAFCAYRKPKDCDIEYSKKYADPKVPELFPKSFRTFTLSSGKQVALQSVFSGYDMNKNDGNFFTHAFIFEDTEEDFRPEEYYGSSAFKTHLTEEETKLSLVRYIPMENDVLKQENLGQWLDLFIKEHKVQLSYLMEKTVEILKSTDKKYLCVSAKSEAESDYYLLALKRLLPPEVAMLTGISTNNTFLPSEKQDKILLNATIDGFNNITAEQIEARTNCIYADFENVADNGKIFERLFELSNDELMLEYSRHGIKSVSELECWLLAYNRVKEAGIGERLLMLKKNMPELFKERCAELYTELDRSDAENVRFEILSVMYDNISDFEDIKNDLIKKYVNTGFLGILNNLPVNMEGMFKNSENEAVASEIAYGELDGIMEMIAEKELGERCAMLLLRMFSIIKQACKIDTWKEFFKNNKDYLTTFVELSASVIINDALPVSFIAPIIWTNSELAEVVAYFDSSTEDEEIKKGCRKFILGNIRENWEKYGITISHVEKNREEREKDIEQVRKMLSTVGYVPFQRGSYGDLKFEVANDIKNNDNPLLLTRLLNAYYKWQITLQDAEAKQCAEEIRELILEMREKEYSCYSFVFPKLALEILSVTGMYHETIITCETMSPLFWNWFLIGASRNVSDDWIFKNYERVFFENENELKKLAVYMRLKKLFSGEKKHKKKGLF